jgi:hypothetical protein
MINRSMRTTKGAGGEGFDTGDRSRARAAQVDQTHAARGISSGAIDTRSNARSFRGEGIAAQNAGDHGVGHAEGVVVRGIAAFFERAQRGVDGDGTLSQASFESSIRDQLAYASSRT